MINRFENENEIYSNFYIRQIYLDNKWWKSTEHYYQAQKARNEEDEELIRNAKTPNEAKKLGRQIKCRKGWEKIKVDVMRKALRAKFTQHQDLKERLINTDDEILVEGNWWHDCYWGSCYCDHCISREKKNMLGILLMELRDQLRKERNK